MHMGSVIPFLGIVFSLVLLAISPMAHAETISHSNQITVNAVVLPAHTVIIDDYDQIIKIYSNTEEQATPTFYRHTIGTPNKVQDTPLLREQYQELVTKTPGKVGTLYERPVILSLLPPSSSKVALPSGIRPPASLLVVTQ